MSEQLTITARDIRKLAAISDVSRLSEAGDPLPESVLQDLSGLVPCDDVVYQAHDPYRQVFVAGQSLFPYTPGPNDAMLDRWFWDHFWTWRCSNPERTGNHDQVTCDTDGEQAADATESYVEYRRMTGVRHGAMISLPALGQISHRIRWVRLEGRGFSEREMLLLRLIRPHLVYLQQAMVTTRPAPILTPRQQAVMRLVGGGLTNRQIARRLQISEATVRTHLQNIYAALKVANRAAAVAATSTEPGQP